MKIEKGYEIIKEYIGTEGTLVDMDNLILDKLDLSEESSLFNYNPYDVFSFGCTYIEEGAEILNIKFEVVEEKEYIRDTIVKISNVEMI